MKSLLLSFWGLFLLGQALGQKLWLDSVLVLHGGKLHVSTLPIGKDKVVVSSTWKNSVATHDTLGLIAMYSVDLNDFDGNGYPDITLTYMGNNDTQVMLLFDPLEGRFRELEGYDEFSFSKRLNGSHDLYWSYHRAGCADNNWESHLFRISKFRITNLGKMVGESCSEKSSERTITIFRRKSLTPDSWIQKDKLQYDHEIHQFDRKWAFMEKYWITHKGEFEQ